MEFASIEYSRINENMDSELIFHDGKCQQAGHGIKASLSGKPIKYEYLQNKEILPERGNLEKNFR